MYDPAVRRRSVRKGRERGCWVYIPSEELTKADVPLDRPPPFYRVWPRKRRTALIQFYLEQ